jgi:hypothetical protein
LTVSSAGQQETTSSEAYHQRLRHAGSCQRPDRSIKGVASCLEDFRSRPRRFCMTCGSYSQCLVQELILSESERQTIPYKKSLALD